MLTCALVRFRSWTGSVHDACSATTRAGKPCRFPPRRGATLCINHEHDPERAAALRRATAASAASRRPAVDLLETAMGFTDRASVSALLDAVVRLKTSGRISFDTAAIILRACSIASHNFDRTGQTLAGPRPQGHPPQEYFDRLRAILNTVDAILEDAPDPRSGAGVELIC